jgi:hypothetical protein
MERLGLLRSFVPLVGKKATAFLNEVVASPASLFAEKRVALEQLKALGEIPDAAKEESLEQAIAFLETLPDRLRDADSTGAVPDEALRRFQELGGWIQGAVLRELLRRDPGQVVGFLEAVLARQADLWEEILGSLEEAPQDEAGRLLQTAYGTVDKGLQKKIRRVHHKRSVRGLPVYPLEREEAEGAIWKPPVPPEPMGLHSMPEPAGSRMVWLIRPNVRKGMLVFGGWVDDQRGLMKFFVMDPSSRDLEKYKASLLDNPEFTVVESEPGFCAWLLEAAYRKGPPLDPEEAEGYKAIRPMLKEVAPSEEPRAPVYAVFPEEAGGPAVEDPLGESAQLLNEELFQGWVMEAERIQPHLDKLEEIERSRIIVHPMQKKERMEAFYRETAQEILTDPGCRNSWKRRLEDAAWVFYKKGMEGQARRLTQMGRYLEDPEKDASRMAFFVELIRRGLEEKLQAKKTEEEQQPSLIVKPS